MGSWRIATQRKRGEDQGNIEADRPAAAADFQWDVHGYGRVLSPRRANLEKKGVSHPRIVAILVLLGSFWLRASNAGGPTRQLPAGVWGDVHARMIVSERGTLFESYRASGRIDRPIILDVTHLGPFLVLTSPKQKRHSR